MIRGVPKMKFKSQLATVAGRTSQQLLKRFTSGGTSLPGKIAQKLILRS